MNKSGWLAFGQRPRFVCALDPFSSMQDLVSPVTAPATSQATHALFPSLHFSGRQKPHRVRIFRTWLFHAVLAVVCRPSPQTVSLCPFQHAWPLRAHRSRLCQLMRDLTSCCADALRLEHAN
eukprot:6173926-Pleurochrysis_carterae.AAC.6